MVNHLSFNSDFNEMINSFGDFKKEALSFMEKLISDPILEDFGLFPFAQTRDYPKSDLEFDKEKNQFKIELAIPGFKAHELNIEVDNGILKISGNSTQENNSTRQKSIAKRRFEKKWNLPTNANIDNLEAQLEDGILTLIIPLSIEKTKYRKIPLK